MAEAAAEAASRVAVEAVGSKAEAVGVARKTAVGAAAASKGVVAAVAAMAGNKAMVVAIIKAAVETEAGRMMVRADLEAVARGRIIKAAVMGTVGEIMETTIGVEGITDTTTGAEEIITEDMDTGAAAFGFMIMGTMTTTMAAPVMGPGKFVQTNTDGVGRASVAVSGVTAVRKH